MMFFSRQWSRLFLVDAKAIFWLTYARFFGRHQARVFAKAILWIFFCSNRLGFRSMLVIAIFMLTSAKFCFLLMAAEGLFNRRRPSFFSSTLVGATF